MKYVPGNEVRLSRYNLIRVYKYGIKAVHRSAWRTFAQLLQNQYQMISGAKIAIKYCKSVD